MCRFSPALYVPVSASLIDQPLRSLVPHPLYDPEGREESSTPHLLGSSLKVSNSLGGLYWIAKLPDC